MGGSPQLPMTPPQEVVEAVSVKDMELPEAAESPTRAQNVQSQNMSPQRPRPGALADALRAAKRNIDTPSESTSEEDYDEQQRPAVAVYLRRRAKRGSSDDSSKIGTPDIVHADSIENGLSEKSSFEQLSRLRMPEAKGKRTYVVASDDKELQEILRRGLQREKDKKHPGRKQKFRDMVFTRQFSTFDRQNSSSANSPFQGFYVLFWIAVAFLIVKMGADNWRKTGNPLGTNEIMMTMFRRDVVVLLASDGLMCGITGVSWLLQLLVFKDYIDWNRSGWILQNIWQTMFVAGFVGLTLLRDWPWTHTVYFVLQGIVMLMKQHSYAFYNGYLSTVYKKRQQLMKKLKYLEQVSPCTSPSATNPSASSLTTSYFTHEPSAAEYRERRQSLSKEGLSDHDIEKITHAIDAGKPLDAEQLQLFERMIKWEIDALGEDLKGKATDPKLYYPNNLTFKNHYAYIPLPTVVYELEYPRSDKINWAYVAEKACATFGLIFVMIMISQAFIYPVVMRTVQMKEEGWPLAARFAEFPWLLSDLVFPFMMEYLIAWYLIWETVLNILAELTYFADRSFYDAWWNSVSWDQFARDWNRPVHNFLLRHVYHSSISSMRVNKYTATLITFFLSACVHELVMWCIFKKLRGYLLMLQMCQLPLVALSRTRWLRNQKTLGNMIFWVGIFTGPSLLCSLYLIL